MLGGPAICEVVGDRDVLQGGIVKNVQSVLKNALGITGLLVAGYVLVASLPDIRRYVRISRM